MVAAVVLAVATILLPDALEVVAGELLAGARLVPGVAELAFVAAVAAVVVVVAQPVLIQAAAVVARELALGAGRRRGTVVQRDVLVGSVHAVRVTVAQPLPRYALRPVPHLVRGAGELCFLVALAVVALVTLVLVGPVQAVVVTVADVDPRYAVAIVAGEQVTETGSAL